MTAYYHLNDTDRHQKLSVVAAVVAWLLVSAGLRLDMLGSSLCVLPWTVLVGLLASDGIHKALRRCQSRLMAVQEVANAGGSEKRERLGMDKGSEYRETVRGEA